MDPVLLQLGFETPVDLVYWLIAAFAGGCFGAAIGALPAFCFTGFAVIAGEAANAVGISGAGSAAELGTSGLTNLVGFGPVFGPHIAFAGGAAAAAYAAKTDGAMPPQEDGGYHPGKDIAYALGTRPDVLAVGGVFHQYTWGNVTMIGLVGGLLGGFLVISTGSMFLSFGISAASLTFLNLGVEKIPVTHHITLSGSAGAAAFVSDPTGTSQLIALLLGGAFGVLGGLVGEAGQRVFYAHGDTHVDPPAFALFTVTLLLGLLTLAEVTVRGVYVPF